MKQRVQINHLVGIQIGWVCTRNHQPLGTMFPDNSLCKFNYTAPIRIAQGARMLVDFCRWTVVFDY
jgi:hypothetical protein